MNILRISRISLFLMTLVMVFVMPSQSDAEEERKSSADEVEQLREEIKHLKQQVDSMNKHILHRPETKERVRIIDGLDFAVGLTGVLQGSSGADDVAGQDQTDVSGSLDLEMEAGIGDRGTAFLLVESRDGAGLTDEIETLHGINADAVDDDFAFKITEAWYEHFLLNERIVLTLGKIDLTNYFDGNAVANDETLQFLADGFVNNIAMEFPEDNGPGLRAAYSMNEQLELGFGFGESDADFEDFFRDGFGIIEVTYKPQLSDLEGNYRLALWTNLSDHEEWKNPSRDDEENWGVGLSFDQALTASFTAFLRAGIQDESVSQVDWAISLGGEFRGLFPSREKDVLGFALGYAHLSSDYEDSVGPLDTDHEQMLELYYAIRVNNHLLLSPDLQVVRHPAGLRDADTIALLGVRAQLLF